jgi:predicted nucleic acid-binding protein
VARFLLDSSFLIDHIRGDSDATARFIELNEEGDDLIICDVSAAEVWSGREAEHPAVERLLRFLEFVQPGLPTSRLAGVWRADARKRGHVLSLSDALIAATAHDIGAAVLTRNAKDFELTPVRIESY